MTMDVNPAIAAAQRRDTLAGLKAQLKAERITRAAYDEAVAKLQQEAAEEK